MIVSISGIKRSGSTAQFNMVRLILEKKFDTVHVTGLPTDIQGHDCAIIKLHTYDAHVHNLASYVFTTDRPNADILRSLKKFNRGDVKPMKKMRDHLRRWQTRKAVNIHYNDIVNNPKLCIEIILKTFGFTDIDPDEILQEFLAIKPPKKGEYDPKTMLFDNHITSK